MSCIPHLYPASRFCCLVKARLSAEFHDVNGAPVETDWLQQVAAVRSRKMSDVMH
jgi:hypothetical protein